MALADKDADLPVAVPPKFETSLQESAPSGPRAKASRPLSSFQLLQLRHRASEHHKAAPRRRREAAPPAMQERVSVAHLLVIRTDFSSNRRNAATPFPTDVLGRRGTVHGVTDAGGEHSSATRDAHWVRARRYISGADRRKVGTGELAKEGRNGKGIFSSCCFSAPAPAPPADCLLTKWCKISSSSGHVGGICQHSEGVSRIQGSLRSDARRSVGQPRPCRRPPSSPSSHAQFPVCYAVRPLAHPLLYARSPSKALGSLVLFRFYVHGSSSVNRLSNVFRRVGSRSAYLAPHCLWPHFTGGSRTRVGTRIRPNTRSRSPLLCSRETVPAL